MNSTTNKPHGTADACHTDHTHSHEAHGAPCGCGSDHSHEGHSHADANDSCGCGSDHTHEGHSHADANDSCGCGSDHSHEGHSHADANDSCGCGSDHSHEHSHEAHSHEAHAQETHSHATPAGSSSATFILENLGCANCAAKMERRVGELAGVTGATVTFTTKQLKVSGENPESLIGQIQEICSSIESEVKVILKPLRARAASEKTKGGMSENLRTGLLIGAGALLFAVALLLSNFTSVPYVPEVLLLITYVVLGLEIIIKAVKNLAKGQLFDENFLMSLATIAAISIGDFAEAVGVILFYRVGELFEDIAVERSRSQIMDAVDLRPEVVTRLEGEESFEIPAEDAQIGDILLVRAGDRIPLDAVVVQGESRLDTSAVTGEHVPVKVSPGSEVISGCINTSGLLHIRVAKVLADSMVSRILDSVENASASKPRIDRFITRFARIYTPFVVLLALATAIIPSLITGNWYQWVYTAITFLVISCPCALVLSVPLAFFSGIGAGSKLGILFKGGVSIEAINNVKAVVLDKTGTITKGDFEVQDAVPFGSLSKEELLSYAASCELNSTHPIAVSITRAAERKQLVVESPSTLKEIAGNGIEAVISAGTLLCGTRAFLESRGVAIAADETLSYGTEVFLALNQNYIGHLLISDTLKPESAAAVAALKKQGIFTAMVTGDSQKSAAEIGEKIGIDAIYAKQLPQDKLDTLQALRSSKGSVMFVGDGINDAPVLAGADVGAAMGSGADAAIEAADVVFMNSTLTSIVEAMSLSRITTRIAMQNVVFALLIKVIVMILGFMGYANMWMAIFADTGVAVICVLNSIRVLYRKKEG
ncbi:MAG: heavy metal translocating P-type ATPase [Lachnospiraceae bacterium]